MTLLIMAIYSELFEKLYTIFKIKRAQEAKHNQFWFGNFKIMRFLKSSKSLKTAVELTLTK